MKPHTKIGFAGMPSTNGRKILRNERLALIFLFRPMPKTWSRHWIRYAAQSWYSELQSDRQFKIALYA